MEFREIIRQLGAKIGIEDLAPDETNACHLSFDDMSVSFMEDPVSDTVVTWSEVCEPPADGADMLYRVLMEAMFMGRGTAGSSFSIDPESGKIFLHRVDPAAMLDLDSFCAMTEKFVNTLEVWRRNITDFRPVAAAIRNADAAADKPLDLGAGGFMQV